MSAADYLANASRPTDEVLDDALAHLREARQIIASNIDEEGTE